MEDRSHLQGQDKLQSSFLDTVWWVVFEEKPNHLTRWWDAFTCPGFRHCWAYTRHPNMDGWLAVDALSGGVTMRFYPDETLRDHGFDDLHAVIHAEGGLVLPTNAILDDLYLPRFSPLTCVELLRHVLGVREMFVFTPFQLYRYIVKNRLNMFEYNKVLSKSSPRGE